MMRRAGFFRALLLSCAAAILTAIVLLTFQAARIHRRYLQGQVDHRLQNTASLLGTMFADAWPGQPSLKLQTRVRELAGQTNLRITLIAHDGIVLADSEKQSPSDIISMENHQGRIELVRARHSGWGRATRISPTMGEPYRYFAVRVDRTGKSVGFVRSALSMGAVTDEVSRGQQRIWMLGGYVGLAALLATYLIVARITKPLDRLKAATGAIAAGNYEYTIPVDQASKNELDILAITLNNMSTSLIERDSQLRRRSQTQIAVLEGMLNSVVAVDRNKRIMFANSAAGKTLNFKPEAVVMRPLLEVMRSHELQDVAQQALDSGQHLRHELQWHGASKRTFDVHASPLPGESCPGVVLVLHEVTELKRLEVIRQQFVANVSHELKTPLSSIKAYAETLLGGAISDSQHNQRFLQRIDEQTDRLHELIQDMLSIARIESGQAILEIVDVPLARVIGICATDFESQAKAADVRLINRTLDSPFVVRADEDGLSQIVNNLVDNAIKYTPREGNVTIDCRQEGGEVILEVADTGIGINPRHHDRLFERFYRVDKARSRELGGTGLGLSIVKHLSQAMGGSVSLESQPGEGSTFCVRLPNAEIGTETK